MATKRITELVTAGNLTGDEEIEVVQGGSSRKAQLKRILGSESVIYFGAVGDGVTDDTVAIQLALDTKKYIYFPSGNYKISDTLVPNMCRKIEGPGKIVQTANLPIFDLTTADFDNTEIIGLSMDGGECGVDNRGTISARGAMGLAVRKCNFRAMTNGVASAYTNQTDFLPGIAISGCSFYDCDYGVKLLVRAEYSNINDCTITYSSEAGVYILGGNNALLNSIITECKIGIYLGAGSNNSHGLINNNTVNHNTDYGLFIENISLGQIINGNSFYNMEATIASIRITGCSGQPIIFTDNQYEGLFDGSGNTCRVIVDGNPNVGSLTIPHVKKRVLINGSLHANNQTQAQIYAELAKVLHFVGDKIPLTGCQMNTSGADLMILSYAERQSSTSIRLFGILIGSPSLIAGYDCPAAGVLQSNISMAW